MQAIPPRATPIMSVRETVWLTPSSATRAAAMRGQQILGDKPRAGDRRRRALQAGAGRGGLPWWHALRQQPGDEAGEHVAGAGGSEPGRRVGIDRDAGRPARR